MTNQTNVTGASMQSIVMASVPELTLPQPYFEKDGVTIYHGDCRKILPLVSADVMVTDPPFGINHASGWDGPFKGKAIANDETTEVRDDVLKIWGDKPALVFGVWRFPVFHAKQALVWDKGEASGMGDLSIPWKPNWELVFVLGGGFEGKRSTGVLQGYTVVTWASRGRLHPNMKPKGLIQELLHKCPAGTVVDPFMGSGTTLVAARDDGRKAIGIELEEKYCETAAKRLSQGVLF